MSVLVRATADWLRTLVAAWNNFWFTPSDPATLSLIRILAGLMLLYTHLVWSLGLDAFFGSDAWISSDQVWTMWRQQVEDTGQRVYFWSFFLWAESREALWALHIAALVVFALLTLGLFSRVVAVLAYLATLCYVHRAPSSLFGLDQINVMLALYLMLGPCGARYSLDALWHRRRRGERTVEVPSSVSANLAIRLIQIHMCVIYFFAGARKLTGASWWDGSAMWLSVANLEYQTLDLTWLAHWPLLTAFLTHLTVWFEISYFALIWPRMTRPVYLALAVLMHLGIAFCMGMITFGLVMLIGNVAFVTPPIVRAIVERRPALAAQNI
ncbi:MAG: HTTM domain-containing protein [Planctomycetota bacterium]|nr:HTTM domain-containing protein [Planctomycetota bacterium]